MGIRRAGLALPCKPRSARSNPRIARRCEPGLVAPQAPGFAAARGDMPGVSGRRSSDQARRAAVRTPLPRRQMSPPPAVGDAGAVCCRGAAVGCRVAQTRPHRLPRERSERLVTIWSRLVLTAGTQEDTGYTTTTLIEAVALAPGVERRERGARALLAAARTSSLISRATSSLTRAAAASPRPGASPTPPAPLSSAQNYVGSQRALTGGSAPIGDLRAHPLPTPLASQLHGVRPAPLRGTVRPARLDLRVRLRPSARPARRSRVGGRLETLHVGTPPIACACGANAEARLLLFLAWQFIRVFLRSPPRHAVPVEATYGGRRRVRDVAPARAAPRRRARDDRPACSLPTMPRPQLTRHPNELRRQDLKYVAEPPGSDDAPPIERCIGPGRRGDALATRVLYHLARTAVNRWRRASPASCSRSASSCSRRTFDAPWYA